MGTRSSAVRTVPGNPLAGILRANARAARNATGRPVAGPQGAAGAPGAPGSPGATGAPGASVAVKQLVSLPDGTFTWTFDTPYATPPVVTATAVSATLNALVTLTAVTATSATGVLWDVVAAAVAPGTTVMLMAAAA